MQLNVTLQHRHRGDLSITLISPSGTRSQLLTTRRNDHSARGIKVAKKIIIIILLLTLDSILALMLVGPSKCLKQTIQIELNRVKNPNWPEANQLAIYKHGGGFELEDYRIASPAL